MMMTLVSAILMYEEGEVDGFTSEHVRLVEQRLLLGLSVMYIRLCSQRGNIGQDASLPRRNSKNGQAYI